MRKALKQIINAIRILETRGAIKNKERDQAILSLYEAEIEIGNALQIAKLKRRFDRAGNFADDAREYDLETIMRRFDLSRESAIEFQRYVHEKTSPTPYKPF